MLLPELDRAKADQFWARYLAAGDEKASRSYDVFEYFGDSVELADELVGLVLSGRKRATVGSVASYEAEGEPIPKVGDEWIAADGQGRPRAVIRATEIRIGPMSSVDDAFAWDEGEGDRTRADWLRGHTSFFQRYHHSLGLEFHPDIELVFERFDVPYTESPEGTEGPTPESF